MSHANARLTPAGRKIIIERVNAGLPQAHVAAQMGLSRATVSKWWRRWLDEGDAGLVDRSSRPRRSPNRTSKTVEKRICRLRKSTKWGPLMLSLHTGVPASTVHRVLVRHRLNRLKWLDRPTGKPIRRYEREHPGELVHLDIKKVGKIPSGGGWRINGRAGSQRTKAGYTYLHCAVDDHSRVAYVEAHDDESGDTLIGFWKRARTWLHDKGMIIDEIMSDNGGNFRYKKFADELKITGTKHVRIKPYRPQTNGKVERFNRTMADEFLYARIFRSETERRQRLTRWVHMYNLHRNHTAVGGPPASRVNNVCGHYNYVLEQRISLTDALRAKRQHAARTGSPFLSVVDILA